MRILEAGLWLVATAIWLVFWLPGCDDPTPTEPLPLLSAPTYDQHTSNGPSDMPGFQSFNRPLTPEDYPRWQTPLRFVEAPVSDSPWTRDANGDSELICIDFDADGECEVQWRGTRLDGYPWTENATGVMWIIKHRDGEGWMQYRRGTFTTVFSERCKECPEFEDEF